MPGVSSSSHLDVDAIAPGDLVLVDRGGRVFYARVLGRERGGHLTIEPLDRQVRARSAPVRVVDHWAPASGRPRPVPGQLQLDDLRP